MKKTSILCLALSLLLGTAGTAQADWGGHHEGHRGGHDGYRHDGYRQDYRRGADWVGPAAILAITGLAIGAAYSQPRPAPTPVYVAPPPPVRIQPASGYWYYCNSSEQYYPYVDYCPEGWQAVAPPR